MYETLNSADGLAVGDRIEKLKGNTYLRGRLLTIYRTPHDGKLWGVILIDKSEVSDNLQHIYPLEMFTSAR